MNDLNYKNIRDIISQMPEKEQETTMKFLCSLNIKKRDWGLVADNVYDDERYVIDSDTKVIFDNSFRNSPAKEIVVPDSVAVVFSRAFENTKRLESISVNAVELIGSDHFSGSGIKKLDLPSIKSFNALYIARCSELEEINLSENLVSLGEKCGVVCHTNTKLAAVHIPEGNLHYAERDGIIYNKDMTELVFVPPALDIKEYELPDTVKRIAPYAFAYNQNIESISLDNGSLEHIGACAFIGAVKLQTIDIPETVTDMDSRMSFMGCVSLRTATFGEKNPMFNTLMTFAGCSSLECVNMPADDEFHAIEIGKGMFDSCTKLKSFDSRELTNSLIIPDKTVIIGDNAFRRNLSFQYVIIPASVERVGNSAFRGCDSLYSVNMEQNAKGIVIEDRAFAESHNLNNVVFEGDTGRTILSKTIFKDCGSKINVTCSAGSHIQPSDFDTDTRLDMVYKKANIISKSIDG